MRTQLVLCVFLFASSAALAESPQSKHEAQKATSHQEDTKKESGPIESAAPKSDNSPPLSAESNEKTDETRDQDSPYALPTLLVAGLGAIATIVLAAFGVIQARAARDNAIAAKDNAKKNQEGDEANDN